MHSLRIIYHFSLSTYCLKNRYRAERINPFPTNTPEGAPFNKPLNSNFSLRVLIHGPLGPAEQGGHPAAQGGGFRAVLGAGFLDPLGGGLLGLL